MPPSSTSETILITGANGQVGACLRRFFRDHPNVLAADRSILDLSDALAVEKFIRRERPRFILNAAAYTAVDAAEDDPSGAGAINADAPGLLARLCAELDLALVHFSTDYVFSGREASPRRETDPTDPRSVYGASKLRGEQAILESGARAVILRTAWLYEPGHGNFLNTMLRLFRERESVSVVSDQVGSPTPAWWAAAAAGFFVSRENPLAFMRTHSGIYHCTLSGAASWFEFARAILEEARRMDDGFANVQLNPIDSAGYPTRAERPAHSVLNCDKLARLMGKSSPHWREPIARAVAATLEHQ